jgi:hypothetical protein
MKISNESKALKVYPTCFDNQLTIQTAESNQPIPIYNQLGICLKRFKSQNNSTVVSMAEFPSGLYLVKANGKETVKVFKR